MSVKRRKDGRWQVYVVQLVDGVRTKVRKSAKTKDEGLRLERELLGRFGRGEVVAGRAPLFEEWAQEFLEVYPLGNNKPSEVAAKKMIVETHLKPFFRGMALDRITVGEVERFKAHQRRDAAAPKTINNRLTVLRRMLVVATEWGKLGHGPKIKLVKLGPQKFRFLDFEESKLLIASTEAEWRAMIIVALRTGLRRGELLALRWEDIDLAKSLVHVQRSVWKEIEGSPKGGRSRKVPLSADAKEALRSLPSRFKKGYVFGAGDRRLSTGEIQYPMIFASRAAELKRVGWHALRHTFASQLVMRGVPLRVIQEWMGHSTIAMTERYAHLAPGFSSAAVSLLDDHAPTGKEGTG